MNSAGPAFGQAHEPDVISYSSRRGLVLRQSIGHEDRLVSPTAVHGGPMIRLTAAIVHPNENADSRCHMRQGAVKIVHRFDW